MPVARWTYALSSLAGTTLFWFYSGVRWTRSDFPIMDNLPLLYEILPLAVLGLVLAATRLEGLAPAALEIIAALFWALLFLSFALWLPFWTTVERLGAGVVDALSLVVGLTALCMCVLAARSMFPRATQSRIAVRLLHAAGLGILGLYFARLSLLIYASTRITLSGGIAALLYEARLRVMVSTTVAVLLMASALVAWLSRRAFALKGSDHVVEQADGADEARL
jgi:hypothetical protein